MTETLVNWGLIPFVKIAVLLNVLLLIVAYITLLERKVIAFMQVRLGPRRVGPHGLLQPIADVFKLLIKEDVVPAKSDRIVFALAPGITLAPAIIAFAVIPFSGVPFQLWVPFIDKTYTITPWITDINVGLLYLLAVSSIGVFGIVLGGWASNSKYPLLGALRSAAQMVSYEVPLGLSIVGVLILAGTASLTGIVRAQESAGIWFFGPQILGVFLYFVAGVAETNRAPFDLAEAETELVAGFHTEYSGMKFAIFFLAEYMNMIVVAAIVTTLFFGGWLPITLGLGWVVQWLAGPAAAAKLAVFLANPFALVGLTSPIWAFLTGLFWFSTKCFFVLFVYLWIRATYPRYRYDQLMRIGWKVLIPIALGNVVVTAIALTVYRSLKG
jgi:NADH-quinone oxidoreductase subunit H